MLREALRKVLDTYRVSWDGWLVSFSPNNRDHDKAVVPSPRSRKANHGNPRQARSKVASSMVLRSGGMRFGSWLWPLCSSDCPARHFRVYPNFRGLREQLSQSGRHRCAWSRRSSRRRDPERPVGSTALASGARVLREARVRSLSLRVHPDSALAVESPPLRSSRRARCR
jgi:hypothetical protein